MLLILELVYCVSNYCCPSLSLCAAIVMLLTKGSNLSLDIDNLFRSISHYYGAGYCRCKKAVITSAVTNCRVCFTNVLVPPAETAITIVAAS